jgi:hypothetical protein
MKTQRIIVALTMAVATSADAQRLEGSATAVSRSALSVPRLGPQTQPSVPHTPTTALAIGGALGAVSAGAILWYGIENCFDIDCLVPVAIAVVWEGIAIPLGVHLVDGRRGPWKGSLPGSYGLELLGILLGVVVADQRSTAGVATVAALTTAAQISYAIAYKRRFAQQR